MTTIPTSAGPGQPSARARGGRNLPLAWLTVPALVFFVGFGVIPLIGVFLIGSRHFIANLAAGAMKF